ncbi:MAG: glycosyltransferase family 2 protein [Saprospiraceae bacterium]|nr:glycosyltransferase family 2 protein [Saprospiraceae bacterium]MBP7699171.1 glycosyltransferase family 2 protein [Saprospiraceae bacterium]
MLSICIPVYNFDVTGLVLELVIQCEQMGVLYEIILMDDASEEEYRLFNRSLASVNKIRYIELAQNVGRSRIRNLLADIARYEHLLFMDCDSKSPTESFIKNYIRELPADCVICGGRTYETALPPEPYRFRWLYGVERESISANKRSLLPYQSFMTNNFIIPKKVLKELRFNETLLGYGHEDTLFGYELKKRKIDIKHIDNPLVHIGLENAEEFLQKTNQGLRNLALLYKKLQTEKEFIKCVKLLRYFHRLRMLKLLPFADLVYKYRNKKLIQTLLSSQPNLIDFDTYKLLTLTHYYRNKKQL